MKTIPVLRVFDYTKIIEFYVDWLGFTVDWEDNPADAPRYMQVSLNGMILHLSFHHGDCSPGAKVVIKDFNGLSSYHDQLIAKSYTYMRPALEKSPWDEHTIMTEVIDPFFNKIVLTEKLSL